MAMNLLSSDLLDTDSTGTDPENVLERLAKTSPGLEIWWDSSPLVYSKWADALIQQTPPEKQPWIASQLRRIYDPNHPTQTLFRGVTTNPPLSLTAMQHDPERWTAWIRNYAQAHPSAQVEDVFWALYKEIVRLGANAFQPIFESSGFIYGYLSGQVDPRRFFDPETMLRQALELSAMAPNVMIKIPGTQQGVGIIRELTARGIPTNCTAAYILPQFIAVAEAVLTGLQEARAKGVDLTHWRSVVTDMSARWENAPEFTAQAEQAGIQLTPEDRRWAGVAIFKQACRIFSERAYPSKMLICSVRMGPTVDGVLRCWHLEETAGANAVFTLPPNFLTEFFTQGDHLQFEPRIRDEIPEEVMNRLQRLPYFTESYDPNGMTPAQFNTISPLLSTFKEFSSATEKMVDFVRARMPVD
jgi:transaldolase